MASCFTRKVPSKRCGPVELTFCGSDPMRVSADSPAGHFSFNLKARVPRGERKRRALAADAVGIVEEYGCGRKGR